MPPGRYGGGPRALFEAMAAGLCPIASENSAAPELIEDGISGFLVPAGDIASLKERISWCAEHPEAVRRMAVAAGQAVRMALDPDRFVEAFRAEFPA